jgi:phage terminase large subunit GpA-like protein
MDFQNTQAQRYAAGVALRSILEAPPELTVSEWADRYRMLSAESSAEPGRWSTDRAPYQRLIMDTYTDPTITDVTFVASAQTGKTECLLNIIGYAVDMRPGPLLALFPTLDIANAWSKDRLSPMGRDTPRLSKKIKTNARDGENTILHKKGPGWQITCSGSNSPASLSSRPIRDLFADEIDRYEVSAGREGSPLHLGMKRTNNFWNRKRYRVSTPTILGASAIMAEWEQSDQRHYYVPCPHCDHMHLLEWANVVWDKDVDEDGKTTKHHPHTATMACPECGATFGDKYKGRMLAKGEWRASQPFHGHAGFRINELYSPWRRFSDVVVDFLEAKDNPETLKVWVNTSLGEPFEEDAGARADPDQLLQRLEDYEAEIPAGGHVLVAGVDIQNDRIEIQVDAYASDGTEECWFVDYEILYGDPANPEVWDELDRFLNQKYLHESGVHLSILGACIDSGAHTQMVYTFCSTRYMKRIHAIKGMAGEGRPFVAEAKQKKKGTAQRKTPLFILGVDDGKGTIMSRLHISAPGPGYRHYPKGHRNCGVEYFRQLTAEKRVKRHRFGKPYYIWMTDRPRNEALDATLYALAAYRMLPRSVLVTARYAVEQPGEQRPKRKISRTRGSFQT